MNFETIWQPPRAGTLRSPRGPGIHTQRQDAMDQTRSSGFEGQNGYPSLSSYHDYPPTQPFIYDDYRRPEDKPVVALPQSNREGNWNQ